MLKKTTNKKSKSTHSILILDNMNILSDQNDVDKGRIPQESSDPIDRKNSVQLTQMVVITKQDNSKLITFDGPSLANNEVLDNTLIYIMMFTYQEAQENPIANNEETSTPVQDDSHQV